MEFRFALVVDGISLGYLFTLARLLFSICVDIWAVHWLISVVFLIFPILCPELFPVTAIPDFNDHALSEYLHTQLLLNLFMTLCRLFPQPNHDIPNMFKHNFSGDVLDWLIHLKLHKITPTHSYQRAHLSWTLLLRRFFRRYCLLYGVGRGIWLNLVWWNWSNLVGRGTGFLVNFYHVEGGGWGDVGELCGGGCGDVGLETEKVARYCRV